MLNFDPAGYESQRRKFMKLGSMRAILYTIGICAMGIAAVLIPATPARGQAASGDKQLLSDQAFKNVQVLKGIPVNEFMEEMGFFSASLTANCTTCHGDESAGSWDKYAVDTPMKQMTRKMVLMMNGINQNYFGGKREVTCYSCHHGDDKPRVTPTVADVYATPPPPEDPDTLLPAARGERTADQILDGYIKALGGAQKLANLKSFQAKGTSEGYAEEKIPVQIYAKAPGERAVFSQSPSGERVTAYNGSMAWVLAPSDDKPVPLVQLTADDLDGAKLDVAVTFPTQLKQTLMNWRVSFPTQIGDTDVEVVQGSMNGKTPVNFYFDKKTGLLLRMVRYSDTKVGLYSTETDFSDYRDVAGIKMPYHISVAWMDGRADMILSQIQPNVSIDDAKFGKPAVPPPGK
jgi:photosynthetic reaction center cytochrome c subunit